MNDIIRVASVSTAVRLLDPLSSAATISTKLKSINDSGMFDIILLPQSALCGVSVGHMKNHGTLISKEREALAVICKETAALRCYIVIGLLEGATVLYEGSVVGVITDNSLTKRFRTGGITFSVISDNPVRLPLYTNSIIDSEISLLLISSTTPAAVGKSADVSGSLAAVAKAADCSIAYCAGGVGESSASHLYMPHCEIVTPMVTVKETSFAAADVDADMHARRNHGDALFSAVESGKLKPFIRPSKSPFIRSSEETESYFEMSVAAFAARLENTGIKKAVIGVSGGLDSTMALITAAETFDRLSLPRTDIIAVTMPSEASSRTAKSNGYALIKALGVTRREVPISAAVDMHLSDIGHGGAKDVTYENAQARERMQILLDIANMESGIVIGTSDQSESALGFSTYGGDQFGGYDVNCSLPKTVIREVLRHLSADKYSDLFEIMQNVLNTPISPELLPADENGNITQKTEDILGPYEIHDFILFYFLKYNMTPAKIYFYAREAFSDKYGDDVIKRCVRVFFKKFFKNQFKRNASSDGASFGKVSLSSTDFIVPSDGDCEFLKGELDDL